MYDDTLMLVEHFDCLFHRSRAMAFECTDAAATIMSDEPSEGLSDDSFIDHFVLKVEAIIERIPEEEGVKLKARAL